MQTLLEQAQQARAALDGVRRANQVRHQLAAIQKRSSEWNKRRDMHDALRAKCGYLSPSETALTDLAKADEATRTLCAEVRERLRETENIDVLSSDESWVRVLQQADKANTLRAGAIGASWRALIRDLGELESAAMVTAREPETPHNAKSLARYRELYGEYAALTRADMPPDAQSVELLRQCVQQLREILSTLTPTPVSVKLFLTAVKSGGAALELLTGEVLEWLKQYDDATRFVIKTRTDQPWR
ncbi:hypothetical protein [Burkholderia gladioli]|uniref:hypothetical protein n=1 Tax=Burkholderia gladioli TaxID=28095 RepID=UPI000F53CEFF|nr:hypothetical protein [Burkholderia gladioli]